ncbi:hypothetical protein LY90DRAFT_708954 [Neocallimastix californiae]|uniref:Uncharacterized protein n=1 Tax=Neocallimastix californiae TaxID=1754190 RepID=A0A1Y1ZHQ5_9FUNG|nr:hypothetical protein LY90DRAFT_708954 [Neocallimastix californiae]|eukprot:ORY09788.1 hypothetical protein LY90DRAFT_708954 [Neocallimastix californiae]
MKTLIFYITLVLSYVATVNLTPLDGEYAGSFKYTNYTMKDIENIEVIKCNTDDDCPEFSNGCALYTHWDGENDIEYNLCEMTFMCHDNSTCIFLNNASTYYINIKEMEYGIAFVEDKIILHSCSKQMYKHNLCETDTCITADNCYSNLCIHDTCITNPNYPSYICRLDWVDEDKKPEMQCKKANGEKCSHDDECDQVNVCDNDLEVCASPLITEHHRDRKFLDYLFFLGVVVTVIIILTLIVLISLFVLSCAYVAFDELKNILFNIGDDYRQLEDTNN